jgi:hypothetical protein
MSDALYKSPVDQMVKMMVDNNIPTYMYVLNTTIDALRYPFWSRVPHNTEYFYLTGAPFMDPGTWNILVQYLPEANCFHFLQNSFRRTCEWRESSGTRRIVACPSS